MEGLAGGLSRRVEQEVLLEGGLNHCDELPLFDPHPDDKS